MHSSLPQCQRGALCSCRADSLHQMSSSFFYFATPPIPLPFPSVGWSSRIGLQTLEMAFASLQRWWMLAKFIPTGTRASDSARMLPPHWGYQGIAGPGVIFLADFECVGKHLCFPEERAACLFAHRACSQDKFPLGTKGKEKLGAFPSILQEYTRFRGNWRHLRKTAAAFRQKKTPQIL